jgi:uncharacterized integral membrane protein
MADDEEVQRFGKKTGKTDGRLVVAIVGLLLAAVFVAQNRDDVQLTLLFFDVTMPLWIGLLITVVISAGAGFLLGRGRYKP